jgi:hypothetical protein
LTAVPVVVVYVDDPDMTNAKLLLEALLAIYIKFAGLLPYTPSAKSKILALLPEEVDILYHIENDIPGPAMTG